MARAAPKPAKTGGHSHDILTTTGVNGDPTDFYFLIDRALANETKMLTPP